jgi:hypothetical protein
VRHSRLWGAKKVLGGAEDFFSACLGGGDLEVVFYFPLGIGSRWVGYADHFSGQVFAVEDEFYVVIVWVFGTLIKIVGVADDRDRGGAASSGD